MPKLNHFQITARLEARLAELESGVEIEARDIKVLLTDEQNELLDRLWDEQQLIRTTHKTKAKAEADGLVWKTKKEIRIDVYKQAIAEANNSALDEILKEQEASEVRGAKIFMDAYCEALDKDKDGMVAGNIALVRNGFKRIDNETRRLGLNERDKEILAMENAIKDRIIKEMSAEEFEQYQFAQEHEKSINKARNRKT
jgi:hypothetical protein